MSKKNQISFQFPQDYESDHPELGYQVDTTRGITPNKQQSPGKIEKQRQPRPDPQWDDPHHILQKPSRFRRESKQKGTGFHQRDTFFNQMPAEEKDMSLAKRPAIPSAVKRKKKKRRRGGGFERLKKRTSPFISWTGHPQWKVLSTAGGAVLVGLLLGIIVLSVFSGLSSDEVAEPTDLPSGAENTHVGENGTVIGGDNDGAAREENGGAIGGESGAETGANSDGGAPYVVPTGTFENGMMNLPPRHYFALQAGAFSEQDTAESVLKQLQEAGLAGLLLREEGTYRLYVGISPDRDALLEMAADLEQEGFDIYIREHQTAEVSQQELALEEEVWTQLPPFLSGGDELMEKLSSVIVQGLYSDVGLSEEEWQAIEREHHELVEMGRHFETDAGEEASLVKQMLHKLDAAVQAVDHYRQQENEAYLWQVQQAQLDYVLQYQRLVHQFNEQ